MTISEKYRKVLEVKNLTEYSAERFLGFGRNTLTLAIKNNRELSPMYQRTFIEKFHVKHEWWDTGKGVIFNPSEEIIDEKHTRVRETPLNNNVVQKEQEELVRVPHVHERAYAGYLTGYADPEYMESLPTTTVSREMVRGGNYVTFTIVGDSMDDRSDESLKDKDIVLGKELQRHHWKSKLFINDYSFIILHKTDGIVCKDIVAHDVEKGIITLHSRNPIYEDYQLNLNDVLQIFFVVQLVGRPLKRK